MSELASSTSSGGLKPGDVVRLRSGGPAMTVYRVEPGDVVGVVWFERPEGVRHAELPTSVLGVLPPGELYNVSGGFIPSEKPKST